MWPVVCHVAWSTIISCLTTLTFSLVSTPCAQAAISGVMPKKKKDGDDKGKKVKK